MIGFMTGAGIVVRDEKLERISAILLSHNHETQHAARKIGFSHQRTSGESDYH